MARARRKNPSDATLRNVRASRHHESTLHTQLLNLVAQFVKLEREVHQLAPRVTLLEQRAARVTHRLAPRVTLLEQRSAKSRG